MPVPNIDVLCWSRKKKKNDVTHLSLPLAPKNEEMIQFYFRIFPFQLIYNYFGVESMLGLLSHCKKRNKRKSFIPRGMDLHPQWLAQDIEHSRHLISTYAIEWFLLEWMHSRMNEHCLLSVGNFESWAAFPLWAFLNLKIYSWNTEARSRNVTFNNQHRKK